MPQDKTATCAQLLKSAAVPLIERARKLSRLEQAVLRLLPENLAVHCKVLNLKNETLILSADSSAWAARLRFAEPALIKQLECQFPGLVRSTQVRIQPVSIETPPKKRQEFTLSIKSGDLLAGTAQDIDHPELQEALYRLAAKARDI